MNPYSCINVDYTKQIQPFWFYVEFILENLRQYLNFNIPPGYGYLLRSVRSNWNDLSGLQFNSTCSISFYDFIGDIARIQPKPESAVPLNLLSSPVANIDTNIPAPSLPINLKGHICFEKILNYYWKYGSTVKIDISGQKDSDVSKEGLQLLLMGYFVLENVN